MTGSAKAVFCFEFFKVGDVLELARAVRGSAREGPITVRRCGGTHRKAHDGGKDIFTREAVANEEIRGRPRFGEIGDFGDDRIALGGVRERSGGIRSGRGNFNLGRRLNTCEFGRLVMTEPTAAEEKEHAQNEKANHQG